MTGSEGVHNLTVKTEETTKDAITQKGRQAGPSAFSTTRVHTKQGLCLTPH